MFHRAAQFSITSNGERHSDFRSEHVSNPLAPRQTGLSVLMNGSSSSDGVGKPQSLLGTMTAMNAAHRSDDHDQDSQARSLAAAGMVAERVRLSQPTALQPPPMLAPPNFGQLSSSIELDNLNWNAEGSGMHVDDLDLDFATLFDPALEEANMQLGEITGWPSSGDA